MNKETKKRNFITTILLWLTILSNLTMTISYVVFMYRTNALKEILGFGVCSMFTFANMLGTILLMRWIKNGYGLIVLSTVFISIVYVFVLQIEVYPATVFIGATIILWSVFQLREEGQSAWKRLKNGWDYKHCRHIYQIFSGIEIILFILTLVTFGECKNTDQLSVSKMPNNYTIVVDEEAREDIADSIVNEDSYMKSPKDEQPRATLKRQINKEPIEAKKSSKESSSPGKKSTNIENATKYLDTHSVWKSSEMAQYQELRELNEQILISLNSGHCRISGKICPYSKSLNEVRRKLMEFEKLSQNVKAPYIYIQKYLRIPKGKSSEIKPKEVLSNLNHAIVRLKMYEESHETKSRDSDINNGDTTVNDINIRREILRSIEKMKSDSIKNAAPKFGLG